MKKEINFGIGFVTGRANVCKVINHYYQDILNQFQAYDGKVNVTFFILYDLSYQYTKRTDFYNIISDVYRENIRIRYITPEEIDAEKEFLAKNYGLSKQEAELFIGYGHAKGRNTVMYYALKSKMDYLLFWDDDEYPVACMKNEQGKIDWKKQNNVLSHIQYMEKEKADVTIGYHCGYISPIPYIEYNNSISEEDLKIFIEAISNELVTWESIKEKFEKNDGVTFADAKIANGEGAYEIKGENGAKKWVSGSTLCLNLQNIDKIPSFYNPPGARGEDTFFSIALQDARVIKIPVYHFHDGFLKYTGIMREHYPMKLKKIETDENSIEQRFLKAAIGWMKYKPLLYYITDNANYEAVIDKTRKNLENSVYKMNTVFETCDFTCLIDILNEYDKNVKEHYQAYQKTAEIWEKIKHKLKEL